MTIESPFKKNSSRLKDYTRSISRCICRRVFLFGRPEIVALQLIHTTARQVTAVCTVSLEVPSSLEPLSRSYEFETNLSVNSATYQPRDGQKVAALSGAVNVHTRWESPKKSQSQTPLMISNPLAAYDTNLRDQIVPTLGKEDDVSLL